MRSNYSITIIIGFTLLSSFLPSTNNSDNPIPVQAFCTSQSFGNVMVAQGNPAYTSYKNLIKNLDLAEKHIKMGMPDMAENNIKNAKRYISYVIKKEPQANLRKECERLEALQGDKSDDQNSINALSSEAYKISFLLQNYQAYITGMFENSGFETQRNQIISMVDFDRVKIEKILGGNHNLNKSNSGGIQLSTQLRNFDEVIPLVTTI